jgi:hypothetical protein
MMKAQLIFEFLIAGAIFFGIVLYGVTLMNSNVSNFRNNFYVDKLNSKAIKISEILASDDRFAGLAPNWPLFDAEKISVFVGRCDNPTGYQELVNYFELNDKIVYGVEIPHFFRVEINTSSFAEPIICGPAVPENVTSVYVERIGVYSSEISADPYGPKLKLKVSVW